RVVDLLPDEDQMGGRHELGDEDAPCRGARERVRAHAEPPVVVGAVLLPELHGQQGSGGCEGKTGRARAGRRAAAGLSFGSGGEPDGRHPVSGLRPRVAVSVVREPWRHSSSLILSPGCFAWMTLKSCSVVVIGCPSIFMITSPPIW